MKSNIDSESYKTKRGFVENVHICRLRTRMKPLNRPQMQLHHSEMKISPHPHPKLIVLHQHPVTTMNSDEIIQLKKRDPFKLVCVYLNINSVRQNLGNIKEFLHKNIIGILFLAETKIDN
jgi:hypothetical protein